MGLSALAGFHRAVVSLERQRTAAEAKDPVAAATADMDHDAAQLHKARLYTAATLADSTKHLVVMAPMCAHVLLYGSRFMCSHAFSSCHVNEALSWVRGGDVSFVLRRVADGDTVRIAGVCDSHDYAYRGRALENLSFFVLPSVYEKVKSPAKAKVHMGDTALVLITCPNTGELITTNLPQRVGFGPKHPQVATHCLRLRATAKIPNVFTVRLLPESEILAAALAATADAVPEPRLVEHALR